MVQLSVCDRIFTHEQIPAPFNQKRHKIEHTKMLRTKNTSKCFIIKTKMQAYILLAQHMFAVPISN